MIFYRIYFSVISLFIIGWLVYWDTDFSPVFIVPAAICAGYYYHSYQKYGREITVDLINSNLFTSTFVLMVPALFIAAILAHIKLGWIETFGTSLFITSVSLYVISPIIGAIISFLPARCSCQKKQSVMKRIKYLLKQFVLMYIASFMTNVILYILVAR